jgi:hypothetical protein
MLDALDGEELKKLQTATGAGDWTPTWRYTSTVPASPPQN